MRKPISIFSRPNANEKTVRVETCQQACVAPAVFLPRGLAGLLYRTLGKDNSSLLNIFGENAASAAFIRGVNAMPPILQEYLAKWNSDSPDSSNDVAGYVSASAATSATATNWARIAAGHQRLFRDVAADGKIYRPIGQLFYFQVPQSVADFSLALSDNTNPPTDSTIVDFVTFTFIEDQCRDVYLFIPNSYDPNDSNTIHTDDANVAQAAFVNFRSENEVDVSAVDTYLVAKAFDSSGTQVAATIPCKSWQVYPTARSLSAVLGEKNVTLKIENMQIATS